MNTLRILEISWLVFCLTGVGLCFYNLATEGVGSVLMPLLFTVIAAVFYMVRRKQRISYDRQQHAGGTERE